MACGTGKTFTSLKIMEKETGGRGVVLFLAPSIALVGQTLREWTAESSIPIFPIAFVPIRKSVKARKRAMMTRTVTASQIWLFPHNAGDGHRATVPSG